jgi:16S rRNA (cytosine1402-N4)-methyltransferase
MRLLNIRPGGIYIDGTFGGGGYARAILDAGAARVIGIDRDREAIARGADLVESAGGRLMLVEARFSQMEHIAHRFGYHTVDGIVLDLGVSSFQLDAAARGFSFRHDGPLDMRMGTEGATAADVVAHASERDLATIIAMLGEERQARAVAHAIVAARRQSPITTTAALAELVTRVVRVRPGRIHPATRTFQALRIFVNDELKELAAALVAAERLLVPGGRLVVVSFHSLEDRIVKIFLADRSRMRGGSRHQPAVASAPTFRLLTKRPVVPDTAEITDNPRARSAKLRAAERTDTPPREPATLLPLPRLPSLADVIKAR